MKTNSDIIIVRKEQYNMKNRCKQPQSQTPKTDAALDKEYWILDESLENVAKVAKKLERENNALWRRSHSAQYILEELNNESGMQKMADLTGLPMGVIVSAFENIFINAEL